MTRNEIRTVLLRGGFDIKPGHADFEDYVYATVDALFAAAVSAPAWKPIETAPKDGSLFLCWVASVRYDEDPETGEFREVDVSEPDFGRWAGSEDGGYYEPMSGLPGDHGAPTHWMPLPAAPDFPCAVTAQGEQP